MNITGHFETCSFPREDTILTYRKIQLKSLIKSHPTLRDGKQMEYNSKNNNFIRFLNKI